MKTITYRDALKEALVEEMERDDAVFLMGEDIAEYGGAYKVTDGLFQEFGKDRIRNTPISEAAIIGTALGAAVTGMRPVAELMYIDFTAVGMDPNREPGRQDPLYGGRSVRCAARDSDAGRCGAILGGAARTES